VLQCTDKQGGFESIYLEADHPFVFHMRAFICCLLVLRCQADIESIYLEADQGYCTDIRDEYIRHFLRGEFVTGGGTGTSTNLV
jgi:hypothetical protein